MSKIICISSLIEVENCITYKVVIFKTTFVISSFFSLLIDQK